VLRRGRLRLRRCGLRGGGKSGTTEQRRNGSATGENT
jgi:hypothetical protein